MFLHCYCVHEAPHGFPFYATKVNKRQMETQSLDARFKVSGLCQSAADFCELQREIPPLYICLFSYVVQDRKYSGMHSKIPYEQLPDK